MTFDGYAGAPSVGGLSCRGALDNHRLFIRNLITGLPVTLRGDYPLSRVPGDG